MTVADKQWLRHPETGGYFHCPGDAVDGWKSRGWEEAEPPQETNPAVVEWQPHPPAEATPEAPADSEPADPKTTKARGAAQKNPEGVNDVG